MELSMGVSTIDYDAAIGFCTTIGAAATFGKHFRV